MSDFVILGCGYTGRRVAGTLLARGQHVIVTTRHPASLDDIARLGATVTSLDASEGIEVPDGSLVLHSVPVPVRILGAPRRMVYLSTTGVYGPLRDVDETTLPAPETEREKERIAEEEAVRRGSWSSLVLRPAAIYGPDRGVHVAMKEGRFFLAGDGSNYVSRIQVEDLAAHAVAALESNVTGAYPVADDLPCTSREIAEFCARLFNLPMPASAPRESLHETRRADRRVDGRAIRARLGVSLKYPTYREGLAAALTAPG